MKYKCRLRLIFPELIYVYAAAGLFAVGAIPASQKFHGGIFGKCVEIVKYRNVVRLIIDKRLGTF